MITQTELFHILIDVISEADDKYDKVELTELCESNIKRLEKKALAAKAKAKERLMDSDDLTDVIESILTSEPQLIADITARINGPDITPAKVASRLGKLAREGKAVMIKVKVPGDKVKKSAYKLAE